ncbi:hypothetical protein ACP8Y2_16880 [Herpetosiphon llansteffanensis]
MQRRLVIFGCWLLSSCGSSQPTAVLANATHQTAQQAPEHVVQLLGELSITQRYAEIEPLYTPKARAGFTLNNQQSFAAGYGGPFRIHGPIYSMTHEAPRYIQADYAVVAVYDFFDLNNTVSQTSQLLLQKTDGLWYICQRIDLDQPIPLDCE